MTDRLRLRDAEGSAYFYAPEPSLVPAPPRTVDSLSAAALIEASNGRVILEAKTFTGAKVQVTLELVGSPPALRARVGALGREERAGRRLARQLPPSDAELKSGPHRVELASGPLLVTVELEPFRLQVSSGELVLRQDRETSDPNDALVVLPLGFTLLEGGGRAYHDTFFAEPDEHFYGFGEKFTSFDKRGHVVSCWNHDALGCLDERSYKNVPFFVSTRGYAVFVDSTSNVRFDMCHSAQGSWSFVVPDDELDYYLLFGEPAQCLAQYQALVGGPELPPPWTFGTWVSNGFSSGGAEEVRELVAGLEERRFPCDVVHLDTYWQRFGSWSDLQWDEHAFPCPEALLAEIHEAGLRASLWINPYIGVESPLFRMAERNGYFLRQADGSAWVGSLWGSYHPPVAIIDMTNSVAVDWWSAMLAERVAQGADLFKTDFGEAIPSDVEAADGTPGMELHNLYSLLYNDAVVRTMRSCGAGHSVVWARSSWAGGQRHAIQWSGDSNSTWQDLCSTIRAGLSMAMSGHHFWSHDIGGFHGTPAPELFVRWAQFGLLSPFSRFHGTTSRLPWHFGEDAYSAVHHAASLRTAIFPYLFAVACASAQSGSPIMRPMVLDYPGSVDARAADLQYLLGHDLLVAPCYRPGGRRPVWFPPGEWAHYSSGEVVAGPVWADVEVPQDRAPLWARVGALLPTLHPRQRLGGAVPVCDQVVLVEGSHTATAAGASGRVVVGSGSAAGESLAELRAERTPTGKMVLSAPPETQPVAMVLVGADGADGTAQLNGQQIEVRRTRTLAGALGL